MSRKEVRALSMPFDPQDRSCMAGESRVSVSKAIRAQVVERQAPMEKAKDELLATLDTRPPVTSSLRAICFWQTLQRTRSKLVAVGSLPPLARVGLQSAQT